MLWLYRLQQRLTITAAEGTALLVASGALLSGLAVRQIQAHGAPASPALLVADDRLAAIDSAAAAAGGDSAAAGPATGEVAAPAFAARTPDAARPPAAAPAAPPPLRRARAGLPAPRSIAINSAPASELERLPRIGPALAGRIVEHRVAHGPFARVEDLEAVRGIGPRMLEQMLPYVRL